MWEHRLERSIFWRLKLGYPIEKLPRFTFNQARTDAEFAGQQLDRLDQLDNAALSHDQQLSLGLVRWQLELQRQDLNYFLLTSPITPYAPSIERSPRSVLRVKTTSDDTKGCSPLTLSS